MCLADRVVGVCSGSRSRRVGAITAFSASCEFRRLLVQVGWFEGVSKECLLGRSQFVGRNREQYAQ